MTALYRPRLVSTGGEEGLSSEPLSATTRAWRPRPTRTYNSRKLLMRRSTRDVLRFGFASVAPRTGGYGDQI